MMRLHVIQGGPQLRDAARMAAIFDLEFEPIAGYAANPLASVERAEENGLMAVELLAPAVAILGKTKAQLMEQLAAVDLDEATNTHAAFEEATAAAHALLDMLQAAKMRLFIAMAAVPR